MSDYAGIFYSDEADGYGFTEAMLPESEEVKLVWQPLIPAGDFDHPDFGKFTVTLEDLVSMEANFRNGLPVGKGIPIDENGLHELRGDGAYGWVIDVRIKDGWLEGGIEWTPAGIMAVDSGELPYVSAHFYPHGSEAPSPWGTDNLILSVALCTRPFFNNQPELRVAATAYKRTGPGVRATANQQKTESEDKVMEDLQKKLDEALAQIKELSTMIEGLTAERDELKAQTETLTTERDELKEQAEALTGEADTAKETIEKLEGRVVVLEEETALADAKESIAATALKNGQQLAPQAVALMATARVKPTEDNLKALQDHLMENGGRLLTVPLPDKDKGLTATASEKLTDEEWLEAKPITDAAKASVRRLMDRKGLAAPDAYQEYLRASL